MTDPLGLALDALSALGEFSDPLAWTVVVAFSVAVVAETADRDRARPVAVGAWALFGVFWLTTFHHFAFVQKSAIEGVGVAVAVPACLSVAALLARGRDSLFVLTRSVAVMGLVFLPFEAVPVLRRTLIEAVTAQTAALMSLLGHDPTVISGLTVDGLNIADKEYPYHSTFLFYAEDGDPMTYTIKIACTGIGSMAIFAGLIAAVDAPLRRKAVAFGVSIPVIYALNLLRNVLIGLGFGLQRFHVFPEVVMALFGVEEPVMVSYYVADRILAQSLSVVALVGITWLVVRELPELMGVVEDAVYVVTRREYDLRAAFGAPEVRADGEGPDGGD